MKQGFSGVTCRNAVKLTLNCLRKKEKNREMLKSGCREICGSDVLTRLENTRDFSEKFKI